MCEGRSWCPTPIRFGWIARDNIQDHSGDMDLIFRPFLQQLDHNVGAVPTCCLAKSVKDGDSIAVNLNPDLNLVVFHDRIHARVLFGVLKSAMHPGHDGGTWKVEMVHGGEGLGRLALLFGFAGNVQIEASNCFNPRVLCDASTNLPKRRKWNPGNGGEALHFRVPKLFKTLLDSRSLG